MQLDFAKTKQSMGEQLWLQFYNQTLFEHGLISESERNKMRLMIQNRNTNTRERRLSQGVEVLP